MREEDRLDGFEGVYPVDYASDVRVVVAPALGVHVLRGRVSLRYRDSRRRAWTHIAVR